MSEISELLRTEMSRASGLVTLQIVKTHDGWALWGWQGDDYWSIEQQMRIIARADTKEGILEEHRRAEGLAMLRLLPGVDVENR